MGSEESDLTESFYCDMDLHSDFRKHKEIFSCTAGFLEPKC
jgi:hypothetical protein